jgi:hypothetical protein
MEEQLYGLQPVNPASIRVPITPSRLVVAMPKAFSRYCTPAHGRGRHKPAAPPTMPGPTFKPLIPSSCVMAIAGASGPAKRSATSWGTRQNMIVTKIGRSQGSPYTRRTRKKRSIVVMTLAVIMDPSIIIHPTIIMRSTIIGPSIIIHPTIIMRSTTIGPSIIMRSTIII